MRIIILLGIFVLTRLNLFKADIQIDEPHWEKRSLKYVQLLKDGKLRDANRFLTHPAFPTNLIFGFSWDLCRKTGLVKLSDPINCGRLVNSIIQFLTFLALLKFLDLYFDKKVSLAGVLTVILSPQIVGIGSILHLDAFVGLGTVLAYCLLIQAHSIGSAVLAGLISGLICLVKISSFVIIVAQSLLLIIYRRFDVLITFITVAVSFFHVLPSLWFSSYRYSNFNKFSVGLILIFLIFCFLYFIIRYFRTKQQGFLLLSFVPMSLVILYFFSSNLLFNLAATFNRLIELKNVSHEILHSEYRHLWVFKLTPVDILLLCASPALIFKPKIRALYLSLLLALIIFAIPQKQALRYMYPVLILILSLSAALVSSFLRKFKIIYLLPLFNALFFIIAKDCTLDFSTLRLFGFPDSKILFPSCGLSKALSFIPEGRFILIGDANLVRKVIRRSGLKKEFYHYPYLANTNYILSINDKYNYNLEKNFKVTKVFRSGFRRSTITVFLLECLNSFPISLPPESISYGGVRTVSAESKEFRPKSKEILFYLPLREGIYNFETQIKFIIPGNYSFSISGAQIKSLEVLHSPDGYTNIKGSFKLDGISKVQFHFPKNVASHKGFFLDVLRPAY